jgi:hypothetical protein
MAKTNANRAALQRHFDLSPKCRRCGSVTSFDVAATHPLRATLEHLYKSGDPRREETKDLPVVARTTLFCYRCNNADGVRACYELKSSFCRVFRRSSFAHRIEWPLPAREPFRKRGLKHAKLV